MCSCRIILFTLLFGVMSQASGATHNVVLMVADDLSHDLGCYGNTTIQTPQLDQLAADGTRFTHAFSTVSSCSSSRSVILTGIHCHANGQFGLQHDYHKFNCFDNILGLPAVLRAAGYQTILCGKHHVGPSALHRFDAKVKVGNGGSRNPVQMAEQCRPLLEASKEKPFFLYYCTSDPHRGGGHATELPLHPDRFGNLAPEKSYRGVQERHYDPDEIAVHGFLDDTPLIRAELAQYYQAVSRVDQGAGRLFEILQETGHWDDTLILFISDHGIAFPVAKTNLYDSGLHVPCIVRNPYIPRRGVVNDAMISWTDIMPTILDFAGALDKTKTAVKPELVNQIALPTITGQRTKYIRPGEFQGRSFLDIIDQEHGVGWDTIYASSTFHEVTMCYPMRVIRGRQYKLIWNIAFQQPFPIARDLWGSVHFQQQMQLGMEAPYRGATIREFLYRPEFELFNIQQDPNERHNLATDPRHKSQLKKLQSELHDFQQNTQDPWAMMWDRRVLNLSNSQQKK